MNDENRIYRWDDFEATIRIFTPEEGGRKTPPKNGIRWDIAYNDDQPPKTLYMIHPDFVDSEGRSYPCDEALPIDVELRAFMYIVVDEMRQQQHREHIKVGMEFFCHEGARRVARGVVTKITGLMNSPIDQTN